MNFVLLCLRRRSSVAAVTVLAFFVCGKMVAGEKSDVTGASVIATSSDLPQVAAPSAAKSDARKTIEILGTKFVLQKSFSTERVSTEEYAVEGEASEAWTQLLTYQRVTLPSVVGADQFVAQLRQHLDESTSAPKFRVVQQRAEASIFAAQYAKSEKAPGQIVLALASIPDASKPNQLHLVQFTLNPERVPLPEMEVLTRRWQARFEAEAAAMTR